MPQVTIRRPFGELDLRNQLRVQPYTVFHLFLRQGPLSPFLLRQIRKRASVEKKRTQWALTKEEMNNCVWPKPDLVAQIKFTEWTPDGYLRHSKFVGLREGKAAREVVREIEG